MSIITLEVETVTPLFIAGADQRYIENEGLRPPSLRGLLRWWFRAIMGGVHYSLGNLDLKKISEEEKKIWGSTDKKSKVSLIVSSVKFKVSPFREFKEEVKYLSYGVHNRPYIEPNSQFKIYLYFRPSISKGDIKKVVATLWLLINLGNIGSKNRKGFGSLRVVKDANIEGLEFRNPNTLKDLSDYINRNLKKCLEIFGWDKSKANKGLPPYSVIAPNYWKMKILKNTFSSPLNAINYIGVKIKNYRRKDSYYRVTKDYDALKSNFSGKKPSVPQRLIFGLPRLFQFCSIKKKRIVKGTKHNRRASPLFIKVWKLNENEFAVGLQLFKSEFLQENKLRISDKKKQEKEAAVNVPSYDYIEKFFEQLSGEWVVPWISSGKIR